MMLFFLNRKSTKIILSGIAFSLLSNAVILQAQTKRSSKADSLLKLLVTQKKDTNRIVTLNALAWEIKSKKPDSSLILAKQAIELSKEFIAKNNRNENLAGRRGMANGYLNSGWFNYMLSDYKTAHENTEKALGIYREIKSKAGEAMAIGNMGVFFYNQGDYPKALDNFFTSLKINEGLVNSSDKKVEYRIKVRMANDLGNIGNVYYSQTELEKALQFFFKAMKIDSGIGNENGVARHLGNIGSVYSDLGDISKSLEFDFRALKTKKKSGYKNGIAKQFLNIGINYRVRGDSAFEKDNVSFAIEHGYKKANAFFDSSMKIVSEIGDKNVIATILSGRGMIKLKLASAERTTAGKRQLYNEAEKFILSALAIDTVIGSKEGVKTENQILSTIYDETGRFEKSLVYYKRFIQARDSIHNEEKNKEITRREMNYEFEKKEAETKAVQDKKDVLAKEEKEKQQIVIASISCGLILVLILATVIFRSLRQNQKKNRIITEQKEQVEKQKELVEEKQKEILDSIYYARRIQRALITSEKYIEKSLKQLMKQ